MIPEMQKAIMDGKQKIIDASIQEALKDLDNKTYDINAYIKKMRKAIPKTQKVMMRSMGLGAMIEEFEQAGIEAYKNVDKYQDKR